METLTPEAKKRILAERDRLMRESVASAKVQPNSSKDVLTAKQRAHVVKISTMLAAGENPYDEIGNKGQVGGSTSDKPTIDKQPRERSEATIKALEEKWGTWNDPSLNDVELDDLDLGSFRDEEPGKLYCTFCHCEVSEATATRGVQVTKDGSALLRKSVEVIVRTLPSGQQTFEEIVKHFTTKLVACPEHALFIRKVDFKHTESEG